jgi:hypothetical protein
VVVAPVGRVVVVVAWVVVVVPLGWVVVVVPVGWVVVVVNTGCVVVVVPVGCVVVVAPGWVVVVVPLGCVVVVVPDGTVVVVVGLGCVVVVVPDGIVVVGPAAEYWMSKCLKTSPGDAASGLSEVSTKRSSQTAHGCVASQVIGDPGPGCEPSVPEPTRKVKSTKVLLESDATDRKSSSWLLTNG